MTLLPLRFGPRSLFTLLTLASLTAACSDPERPPSEAAYNLSVLNDPTPMAPYTLQCPISGVRRMIPSQVETMNPNLVLSANTGEMALEGMATVQNGQDGDVVSCTVREEAEGSFSIQANIEETNRLQFNAQTVGQFSTTSGMTWLSEGFQYQSQTCSFSIDARADGSLFIEPGTVKASFSCDPLYTSDQQACLAEGTIYLTNCNE